MTARRLEGVELLTSGELRLNDDTSGKVPADGRYHAGDVAVARADCHGQIRDREPPR